jgi:hypothetical protein
MPKYIKTTTSNTKGGYFVPPIYISTVVKNIYDDMEHIDTGDSVVFTVVEMTQEEYDKLHKFEKW